MNLLSALHKLPVSRCVHTFLFHAASFALDDMGGQKTDCGRVLGSYRYRPPASVVCVCGVGFCCCCCLKAVLLSSPRLGCNGKI